MGSAEFDDVILQKITQFSLRLSKRLLLERKPTLLFECFSLEGKFRFYYEL